MPTARVHLCRLYTIRSLPLSELTGLGWTCFRLLGATPQDVRKAFIKADRDGDGLLNKADVMAFLKRHGIDATEQEVSDAILFADTNRDGKITMEEFVAAFNCGIAMPPQQEQ